MNKKLYDDRLINWLLEGDISIQYQTFRDLLGEDRKDLQEGIATSGWGTAFLSKRRKDGQWGLKFYQPKWTSSHYTLLDLRNLCISPSNPVIRESIQLICKNEKGKDGGINPSGTISQSDVCLNGMFLNYASYFGTEEEELRTVIDFILGQHMPDGGFNCRSNRSGAVHSSLHTSLSVLEGFLEYKNNGYSYRLGEIKDISGSAEDFIFRHNLYLSDRTGEIIRNEFLRFTYPGRWKYDILRALEYFRNCGNWNQALLPALRILIAKRSKDGTWKQPAGHPGQIHFLMDHPGKPGRWNTLRALRVLEWAGKFTDLQKLIPD